MSDGDALFTKACLSVSRSVAPRDGGAAIGAMADWVQEQINDGCKFIALADTEHTGFVGLVLVWSGSDLPVRVTLLQTEDPSDRSDDAFTDTGEDFRKWFADKVFDFWRSEP